ncbi:MAG: hypothetical protein ACTSPB_15660 [Candidatus Thorarchaeota archaeon]
MRIIDKVGIRSYREEVAEVAGVEMKLASLSERENEALLNMLDKYLYVNASDAVKNLVVENVDLIVDLVRAVKAETKQEFAGPRARGNQLTIVDITADQLTRVWGATGATDFSYTATATGAVDYIGTSANPETTAEEEGLIYLGFTESAVAPKTNKMLLTKNGDAYPYSNLMWESQEEFYLAALPEPYFIPPETSYYISVNFFKTGKVEMKPIGFKVLQAKNVLSL